MIYFILGADVAESNHKLNTIWNINGFKVERQSEKAFIVYIENEFKKVLKSFKEAFLFVSSTEAVSILEKVEEKKQLKQKLAKNK